MLGCSYSFLKAFADSDGASAERLFDGIEDCGPGSRKTESSEKSMVGQMRGSIRGLLRRCNKSQKQKQQQQQEGSDEAAAASLHSQYAGSQDFNMGVVCNGIIKPRTTGSKLRRSQTVVNFEELKFRESQAGLELAEPRKDSAPSSLQRSMSYAELGQCLSFKDARGRPAFAKATHFVSHAWKCDFRGFVAALGFWLEQSGTSEDDAYFWVDAFVVNQHQTQAYPQEWWSTRFMQAIGDIGNTILVVDPWQEPVPLSRAWVIWELYCTTRTGAKLHLAMSRASLGSFKDALLESFEQVQTILSRVDVSRSQAFHAYDQEMIHAEIQSSIGFTKMNEVVQTRMMQWLMEMARGELQALVDAQAKAQLERFGPFRSEGTGRFIPTDRTKYFQLKENLARMMRESGAVGDAECFFSELLQDLEKDLGPEHPTTLSALNQLAVTVQKSGRISEALDLLRDCLRRREHVLGKSHEDTLQSASNLAVLLGETRPLTNEHFNEARGLYALAVAGREAGLGQDHPRTLYTVSNWGKLLSLAPDPSEELMDEAEVLHARAVGRLQEVLHAAHPLALTAMHNQACHWLVRAKMISEGEVTSVEQHLERLRKIEDTAEKLLQQVLTKRTQNLGKEHPDTVQTQQVINSMFVNV
jgi:hypothetical protein